MARSKRGELDYRRPLPRESAEAFGVFQEWLKAGAPRYAEFAESVGRTERSIQHFAQRHRWQERAKAKARQDAMDGFGDPVEDAAAVERLALRVVRSAFQRCADARERLEKKGGDWEVNAQVVAAGEAVSREELNAVRMLAALRRAGHGGDRTGQHGPAQGEPDDADREFERLALPAAGAPQLGAGSG